MVKDLKGINIDWSEEEKEILNISFSALDELMFRSKEIGDKEKIDILQTIHSELHDLTLASNIKKIENSPDL